MEVIKDTKEYETEERNILGDCEKVLGTTKEGRIFNIFHVERNNGFYLHEYCDEYFELKLTSKMCKDLAELFSKIAKRIEEETHK